MDYLQIAREAARRLDLLDEGGALRVLDSLSLIDYVLEIENTSKLHVPTSSIDVANFSSLETVAATLGKVAETGPAVGG